MGEEGEKQFELDIGDQPTSRREPEPGEYYDENDKVWRTRNGIPIEPIEEESEPDMVTEEPKPQPLPKEREEGFEEGAERAREILDKMDRMKREQKKGPK